MFYQWGRKDPYTFATNNISSGIYPVKIYTIEGVLIYQEKDGSSNKDKQPAGGVLLSWSLATSMMETIKNPITFHGGSSCVISQDGHTKYLWDYYWTSYSRGTDGNNSTKSWHNSYLNGYTSQLIKSIYDPCPFGFKMVSNGTFNIFNSNLGWDQSNATGGVLWSSDIYQTWLSVQGHKGSAYGVFYDLGIFEKYFTSTPCLNIQAYSLYFDFNGNNILNNNTYYRSIGFSVRCIDFAMLVLLLRT